EDKLVARQREFLLLFHFGEQGRHYGKSKRARLPEARSCRGRHRLVIAVRRAEYSSCRVVGKRAPEELIAGFVKRDKPGLPGNPDSGGSGLKGNRHELAVDLGQCGRIVQLRWMPEPFDV